jgi:hypothetical protein
MIRPNFMFSCVALLALSLSAGCVSGGGSSLSTVVDAIEGVKENTSPYVDAYIQFLGPDARWTGPVLWSVHVSARESQLPDFEVTPALPKIRSPGAPELSNRIPASALGIAGGKSIPAGAVDRKLLSLEQVRDRLRHLGGAMAASDDESSSCISAVKVRMTRADGSVVEKQACRGSAVWTQVASELAAEFMTQSRYPRSAEVSPAEAPAKDAPSAAAPKSGSHG